MLRVHIILQKKSLDFVWLITYGHHCTSYIPLSDAMNRRNEQPTTVNPFLVSPKQFQPSKLNIQPKKKIGSKFKKKGTGSLGFFQFFVLKFFNEFYNWTIGSD